jgi:hypothetical protein
MGKVISEGEVRPQLIFSSKKTNWMGLRALMHTIDKLFH